MSRKYESNSKAHRGKSIEKEIQDFFKESTIQRLQRDEETRQAVITLRAENARRRLQDQRDMDEHYRNYIIPV